MERRLSVVAQQSAKSKERAEAATKWLDKQIRMVSGKTYAQIDWTVGVKSSKCLTLVK